MEEKELQALITNFIDECEKNNYHAIAAIKADDYRPSHVGILTDPLNSIDLLVNVIRRLQVISGIPSTILATELALTVTALDINSKSKNPLREADYKIYKKAAKIVKDNIDNSLKNMQLGDSQKVQ